MTRAVKGKCSLPVLHPANKLFLLKTVNFLKFQTFLNSLFSKKMWVIWTGIHKILVKIANRKTLIRLLLKKQSDLGLTCLSRPF